MDEREGHKSDRLLDWFSFGAPSDDKLSSCSLIFRLEPVPSAEQFMPSARHLSQSGRSARPTNC